MTCAVLARLEVTSFLSRRNSGTRLAKIIEDWWAESSPPNPFPQPARVLRSEKSAVGGTLKAAKYSVLAAVLLVILAAPSRLRADSIVAVVISNLTFTGCCSPSATQTFNAVFLVDNTTNSYVAGSFFYSTFGGLGSSLNFTQGPVFQNGGGSFSLTNDYDPSSNDPSGGILFSMSGTSTNFLSTGAYS